MYVTLCSILVVTILITYNCDAAEVIWAVNCGGDMHVDKYGIKYLKDMQQEGEASDYGKQMFINRVHKEDQVLYQTERYHSETFGYNIPIRKDGSYVLVLKFSEVWFSEPNRKVFDVSFNDVQTVISGLDIFDKVGRGVAHDEMIPFLVEDGEVHVGDGTNAIPLNNGNLLNVLFVKTPLDNPKINAIYVLRGKLEDIPMLPDIQAPSPSTSDSNDDSDDDDSDEMQDNNNDNDDDFSDLFDQHQRGNNDRQPQHHQHSSSSSRSSRRKPRSSDNKYDKHADPYADDLGASITTSGLMIPIAVAVAAVLPLLYCLCNM